MYLDRAEKGRVTIEPTSSRSPDPGLVADSVAQVARSGRRVSVTSMGTQGTEVITGPIMDSAAQTSTNPGFVTIYDVKNQQVVIKSPAPQNLASA